MGTALAKRARVVPVLLSLLGCGTDDFAPAGTDAAEASDANGAGDAGDAVVGFCKSQSLNPAVLFCNDFDPPLPTSPPYGWDTLSTNCPNSNAQSALDTTALSPPGAVRLERGVQCGSYLIKSFPVATRDLTFAFAVYGVAIPLASGDSTVLGQANWEQTVDGGAPKVYAVSVEVRGGSLTLSVYGPNTLVDRTPLDAFSNGKWFSVEFGVKIGATTTNLTAAVNGTSVSVPPSAVALPTDNAFFVLGPATTVGTPVTDIRFDNVLISKK